MMEQVDHISDELIYFSSLRVLCRLKGVLDGGVVLPLEVKSLPSDFGSHIWVVNDSVKLWDDFVDQLFCLHAWPALPYELLLFQLLVEFYLTQIVFKEDDLDFILFHLTNAVQHFKGEDLDIGFTLKQKIKNGLVKWLTEEGIIANINFAQLIHVAEVSKLTTVADFVTGNVQLFQERELCNVLQACQFVLAQIQALDFGAENGRNQIDGSDVFIFQNYTFACDGGLFCKKGRQVHLSFRPHSYRQLQCGLTFQNRMSQQKYYHNDYKKMMGLDQTRTKSQKLLDRAVGGFRQREEVAQERVLQKKVKQQHTILTHCQIMEKLVKSIEATFNAGKVLKPLNILKKCMNDQSFVTDAQINVFEQWSSLAERLLCIDDKLIGNFSEMGLVFDYLVQILQQILVSLRKLVNCGVQVKQQLKQEKQDQRQKYDYEIIDTKGKFLIQTCQMHLLYCKMYTDDSFTFNKILGEFKRRFYGYFQLKLTVSSPNNSDLFVFLQKLLQKMFRLPHAKYEWVRQALTHFFKDFNIQFRHLLSEQQSVMYLKLYNEFINQKSSIKIPIDPVNVFGNGGKGGKITSLEVGASDGLDKWTSKQ